MKSCNKYRNNTNNRYTLLLILLVTFININAQDPSFSSFYFNQLYYNPAYCGSSRGIYVSGTHRSQWVNIPGKYITQKASVDWNMSHLVRGIGGLGLIVTSDGEGPASFINYGSLNTFSLGIPLSIRPKEFFLTNKRSNWNFQFGVMPEISQKFINWDAFVFSDQYNPYNGLYNSNTDFSPPQNNTGGVKLNLSTGVIIDNTYKLLNNTYTTTIGFAYYHMLEQKYYIDNLESKLYPKLVANINLRIASKNNLSFSPSIIWEKQKNMQTYLFGANVFYRKLYGGGWMRTGYLNMDALIFLAGFQINSDENILQFPNNKRKKNRKHFNGRPNTFFTYSYDFNISSLGKASGGSHEINLTMIIPIQGICDYRQYVDPFKLIIYNNKGWRNR